MDIKERENNTDVLSTRNKVDSHKWGQTNKKKAYNTHVHNFCILLATGKFTMLGQYVTKKSAFAYYAPNLDEMVVGQKKAL